MLAKFSKTSKNIYTPQGFTSSYQELLKTLCNINELLKCDGVLAPTADSLINTKKLYESFNKPLDSIPTIHVGGTNGKVVHNQKNSTLIYHIFQ
jgi:hypothetical protein